VIEKFWSSHEKKFICDNQKHSVANHVVTKFIFFCMFLDMGHLIDDGLISTIDLVTKSDLVTKFALFGNKK
jgi:hypothetical protein